MPQSRQSDCKARERRVTEPSRAALKPKRGRPCKEWDADKLFEYGTLHCTLTEIARGFKVCDKTVDNWARDPDFYATLNAGKSEGCTSLRRKLLGSDNPACMIFSAKNLLGWTDKQDITTGGERFGAIPVLTTAELAAQACALLGVSVEKP